MHLWQTGFFSSHFTPLFLVQGKIRDCMVLCRHSLACLAAGFHFWPPGSRPRESRLRFLSGHTWSCSMLPKDGPKQRGVGVVRLRWRHDEWKAITHSSPSQGCQQAAEKSSGIWRGRFSIHGGNIHSTSTAISLVCSYSDARHWLHQARRSGAN